MTRTEDIIFVAKLVLITMVTIGCCVFAAFSTFTN